MGFGKIVKNIKVMKIRTVEAEVLHADGQTQRS